MVTGSPIVGKDYTLECSAGGSEGIFQWLGPPDGMTSDVDNRSNVNIVSTATTSQLQFRPIQQSDNGSYSCNAIIGGLALSSEPVVISVNGTMTSNAHYYVTFNMSMCIYFSSICISPNW